MIEKILVPLDGSDLSGRILTHVRRLLARKDCEVMLARVVPKVLAGADPSQESLEATARDQLDRLAKPLAAQGARVSTKVLTGDPAGQICDLAQSWGAGLMALATHGRTGLGRWVRGSVAERILRAAPVPVLAANPLGLSDLEELRFKKILVAVDGSERASSVLPVVLELARLYESEVVLHLSIEMITTGYPVDALVMTVGEAQGILRSYAARLPGIKVRTSVGAGSPAASILDAAQDEGASLVALTTHGRSGAARWLLGSVAEQVLRHAKLPVLVVRSAEAPVAAETKP